MKDIHLNYKRDTGSSYPQSEIETEESDFIPDHYLIKKEELISYMNRKGEFVINDPDYIQWLENKVTTLSRKLSAIQSKLTTV